jgi:hypothetical protein
MNPTKNPVRVFGVFRIARLIFHAQKSSLTLSLSPRRGNSQRQFPFYGHPSGQLRRTIFQSCGVRFSFSPGEKAGMRAGVPPHKRHSIFRPQQFQRTRKSSGSDASNKFKIHVGK